MVATDGRGERDERGRARCGGVEENRVYQVRWIPHVPCHYFPICRPSFSSHLRVRVRSLEYCVPWRVHFSFHLIPDLVVYPGAARGSGLEWISAINIYLPFLLSLSLSSSAVPASTCDKDERAPLLSVYVLYLPPSKTLLVEDIGFLGTQAACSPGTGFCDA